MQTFRLTLEYDGSKFSGWQAQINARTVQGELKRAATEVFGRSVETTSGVFVHAHDRHEMILIRRFW